MRTILSCVVAVLAACGGGGEGGNGGDDGGGDDGPGPSASFDEELPAFIDAYCEFYDLCADRDLESCKADVADQMADAKEELDEVGEVECAECMALTVQIIDALGNSCEPSNAQVSMLEEACGALNERCSGYPIE